MIKRDKLQNTRKIKMVARTESFKEAERLDDEYWANASEQERFSEMIRLTEMVFGKSNGRIQKVVNFKNRYEDD